MTQPLPEWSIDREIGRLLDFHTIAVTGIGAAGGEPELLRALRDVQRGREGTLSDEDWSKKIDQADKKRRSQSNMPSLDLATFMS